MKPPPNFAPHEPEVGSPYCSDPDCQYCAELRAAQDFVKTSELDPKSKKANAA